MMEVVLSVRLERELTKAEILEIYLNHVYLGHGAYGVGAAAETYFGKEVEDLTIAEAALLAGLVASPTKYAPTHNMKLARERQKYVLGHMREDHYISEAEYQAALAEPIALVDESDLNHLASPYFVEHVRRLATAHFGNAQLFVGGLRFYSTLDQGVQRAAEDALRHGLESLDRKLGFRGAIGAVAQPQPRHVDRRTCASAERRERRYERARRSIAARAALRRDGRRVAARGRRHGRPRAETRAADRRRREGSSRLARAERRGPSSSAISSRSDSRRPRRSPRRSRSGRPCKARSS